MGKSRKIPPAHRCLECNKPVAEEDWGQAMCCPICAKKLCQEMRVDTMEKFKESLLARYIKLWEKRDAEFDRLPNVERRVACGNYNFRSGVDIELDELTQEAMKNGFILGWHPNGEDAQYTIKQMSPEAYAEFLAEEEEDPMEEDTLIPSFVEGDF